MFLLQQLSYQVHNTGFFLAEISFSNVITKYVSPGYLLMGIKILAICIGIVVAVIYSYLSFKKRTFFYTSSISKNLEVWISAIIMEESIESIVIPKKFFRMMKNSIARQFVIDELVGCKKNFSGLVGENIAALYLELGLKEESLRKINSRNSWHIRAKGIQELYMMDQKDVLTTIYKNTNSTNEYVRMEAQTGVIHLTGFPGLRFLDVISYPLTEWQQLKLLEQLRISAKKEDLSEKIPHWLTAKNDTVVVFALKLADEYQQFSVTKDVLKCLVHQSAQVRSQALKTLVRLADEKAPMLLLGYISKEPYYNQAFILDALKNMATDNDKDFLVRLLDNPNDMIKLKAAIVIANCCTGGLEIIQQRAAVNPEPFQRILLHIQSELI